MEQTPAEIDPPLLLVVEDMADARELLLDILVQENYRVVAAENGLDAADTAVKLRPAAIVMDLSLPLLGGIEAAMLLKVDPRTRKIPLIALTAHGDRLSEARAAGFDAFLTKPCPSDQLLATLRKVLGIAPSTRFRTIHGDD